VPLNRIDGQGGPMPKAAGEITQLLGQLRVGREDVADQLVPLIYDELRKIARGQMARERPGHTLQATAVAHEAYLRLVGDQPVEWQSRTHFFAIAAHTVRRVLLDHARKRHAGKRGGDGARKVELDAELLIGDNRLEDVIALDEVLERLSQMDPEQGRMVELRFFGGLSVEETAEVMGISARTVKREWRLAKAWLGRELTPKYA
jgi:RNA polymerase sigma-70 factor (ECF subfamily)